MEFGAGTGQFTVHVAPACAQVIAVDVSPLMLQQLHAKIDALRLSNVEVVRAGFLTYEHGGRPADFIYSRFALHHLPDFWKAVALSHLRRMVRPGGVLRLWDVVYDFASSEAEDRIEAWCATGGDAIETEWSQSASARMSRWTCTIVRMRTREPAISVVPANEASWEDLQYRLLVTGGPIDAELARGVVELILRGFAPAEPSRTTPAIATKEVAR